MPEPRRWTLKRGTNSWSQTGPLLANGEQVEVMPVSEHGEAMAALRAEAEAHHVLHMGRAIEAMAAAQDELTKAREITDDIRRAARAVLDKWEPSMILTVDERTRFAALRAALGEDTKEDGNARK